jgi:putative transposase
VTAAKAGLAKYIKLYNTERPHSSMNKKTPDEFYFATLPAIKQAA